MTDKKKFSIARKRSYHIGNLVHVCIRVRLYLCVVVRMSRTHRSPQESVNERHKAYTSNIF